MPQRWGDCPWNFLSKDDPIRQRFIGQLERKPDIWMQITIPSEFQPVGQFNIGISAGIESTVYPADFIEGSNRMNLNLVSSEHSKQVALNCNFERRNKQTNEVEGIVKLEKPIEVLFEGLDLTKYNKKPQNSGLLKNIPEDFCFLYTGHWLQGDLGEDRKNTGLMIKTFLETFNTPSKKKPALILKCNAMNYSLLDREHILGKINQIRDMVGGNLPNIYLLHGEMTDDEMNQLNNDNKVKAFVSFTKGEGYGRPLVEAAITGKPVMASNWSGHVDFLHPNYNVLLGGELKPIHKSSANQWLIKESQWFNINAEVAGRSMKDVFKNYKGYFEKSRKQTQYLKDNFSFDKMCDLLKGYLDNYIGEVKPTPKNVPLQLPKLQPLTKQTPQELPKIELPKLK